MHFLISLCETTSEALQNPASCRIDFLPLPLNPYIFVRVDSEHGNISNTLKRRTFAKDIDVSDKNGGGAGKVLPKNGEMSEAGEVHQEGHFR